jgi:hypothetical protein
MFSLTIVFGPGPMVWTLMFKTEDKARLNVSTLNQSPLGQVTRFVDDFGQECDIITDELKGWMLEDMEQSKLAHIERALHQARTQAKGAEIADSDPVLAQARRRAQGGMPIMQPMPTGFSPNGRFPS